MPTPISLARRVPGALRAARKKPILRWRTIPALIISRDRLSPLADLIAWLEDEGMRNIIILDNASTYPPLVGYLAHTPHRVIQLGRNVGHLAPWEPEVASITRGRAYIVTDNDVVPDAEAHGAVKVFVKLLNRHRTFAKAGFGLHIDDLPDHYEAAATVAAWEKQFWQNVKKPGVYVADIDTTFALYRPGTGYTRGRALRTGAPYLARHTPWYVDSANPDAETQYYLAHARSDVASWGLTADKSHDYYR